MDLEERLRAHVNDVAAAIPTAPGDPAAVAGRGERRRRHRIAAAGATLGIVLVAAIGVGVWIAQPEDERDQTTTTDDGEQGLPDTSEASIGGFTWEVAASQSDLGLMRSLVRGADGAYYALSTAPGGTAEPDAFNTAMYRSDDLGTWTVDRFEQAGFVPTAIAEEGGVLYALATAPSPAAIQEDKPEFFDLVAAQSTDGGTTWTTTTLPGPYDPADPLVDSVAFFDGNTVVARPGGQILLVAHGWPVAAVRHLIPAEYQTDEFQSVATAEGVEVFAGTGEEGTVYEATWTELGVDAAAVPAQTGISSVYVSDDAGQTFEHVEVPFTEGFVVDAMSWQSGYLAVVSSRNDTGPTSTVLWVSDDGRQWTSLPGLPTSGYTGLVGAIDGALIVLDQEEGGGDATIWRSADGQTWTEVGLLRQLAGLDDSTQAWFGDAGPTGIALHVVEQPDFGGSGASLLVSSPDGITWGAERVGDLLGDGTARVTAIEAIEDGVVAHAFTGEQFSGETPPDSHVLVAQPSQ